MTARAPVVVPPMDTTPEELAQAVLRHKPARRESGKLKKGQPAEGRLRTFADLFCGVGGFHVAAAELGLECVFACDIDAAACAVYERNFAVRLHGDIAGLRADSVPDHDVLFAGLPCQPFGIIGAHTQGGGR